jgi:hypothetical protein
VYGNRAFPPDSLKALHTRSWSQRTDEQWTNDRVDVVMLNDTSALLTITQSGHYTTTAGVAWEYKASAFVTALVQKRGSAWKVVASHISSGGTQVKK